MDDIGYREELRAMVHRRLEARKIAEKYLESLNMHFGGITNDFKKQTIFTNSDWPPDVRFMGYINKEYDLESIEWQ